MQFTPLPRFHRSRLAWSVLLLAAPFAGNLYAADAAPVTPTAGVIAATVNVPTGECRKAIIT